MIPRTFCQVLFLLVPLAGCTDDIHRALVADPGPKVTVKVQAEVAPKVASKECSELACSSSSAIERSAMQTSQPVIWSASPRTTTFQTASLALG
jgi:hypothetical protein